MNELDEKLRGLRAMAINPRLEMLEDAVMGGLATRHEKQTARQQVALSAILALVIGMAGSMVPGNNASAAAKGGGLIGAPALAPSQLLGQ